MIGGPKAKPILGLETEYALLLRHEAGGGLPAPRELVQALIAKLSEKVLSAHAAGPKLGMFLASGGLVHGEAGNLTTGAELLEICTPECTTPRDVVAQQRAHEKAVRDLLAPTRAELMPDNPVARASLLKCSIDADGNTFSTHENYRVRDRLPAWRRAALAVVFAVSRLVGLPMRIVRWALVVLLLGLVFALVAVKLALAFAKNLYPGLEAWSERADEIDPRAFSAISTAAIRLEQFDRLWVRPPLDDLMAWLIFPGFRRHLPSFLSTRQIFTAPGHFETRAGPTHGRLVLSPKAEVLTSFFGFPRSRDAKPVVDVKHLVRHLENLWAEEKRLSVTFSDTNMSEFALWLKVGTTLLVLQMIEAGVHPEGFELEDPLEAIRQVSADPLGARLARRTGTPVSALDVQRAWHVAAERFLAEGGGGLEADEVVREWGAVLAALETDPESLLDRVDWVAKQVLLRDIVAPVGYDRLAALRPAGTRPPGDEGFAWDVYQQARKLDLKYHDLGEEPGYQAMLEARGEMRRVIAEPFVDLHRAPPVDTRAWHRGAYLRLAAKRELTVLIGWERVFFPGSLEVMELPPVDQGLNEAKLTVPDPVRGVAWLRRLPAFAAGIVRAYDPVQ